MSLPPKHAELVEQLLLQFDEAWRRGEQPEIDDYLRDQSIGHLDASTQATLLRELVMIDLEYRWKTSIPLTASADSVAALPEASTLPRLEDYCRRLPLLGNPSRLPVELISQEYYVRHRWGDRPEIAEYVTRFRDDDALLHALRKADQRITEAKTWEHEAQDDSMMSLKEIGRYRVMRLLDKGAQAYVFQAMHPTLQQDVVIKLSRFSITLDSSETARLLAEARIIASLRHPRIARVYDFDFYEGRPFLVMDFIRGRNLCDVASVSRMPADDAVAWVVQIADALGYVHQSGVVHQDINPRNIVLDDQQQPHLIDFGVSTLFSSWMDRDPDRDSVVCGTAAFMSPEQAAGKQEQISVATDVFGTGALLYFLLTGTPPYLTEDFEHALQKAQACDYSIPKLQQHCSSASLVAIVCRAMHPDPAQRFPNMEALAKSLRVWRRRQRTRRYWPVAIAGVAVAMLFLLIQWNPVPERKQSTKSAAEAATAVPVELAESPGLDAPARERVAARGVDMAVQNYRGADAIYLGDMGFPRKAARVDDDLRVSCRFDAETYCYLIALNTDGTVQSGYPADASQPPAASQELIWPSTRETYYGLTDGVGTQGVLLISSTGPLPAFDTWIAEHGPIPWRSAESVGVWHWDSDRPGVSNLVRLRGELRKRDEPHEVVVALVEYCEKLVAAQECRVQWMTFPVVAEVQEDEEL